MKKLLLLGFAVMMTFVVDSQVKLIGVSPQSIAGTYDMKHGAITSNWGYDLTVVGNGVEGTLVEYLANTACDAATNSTALDGNFAILYRGDCGFGVKVQNAEAAGAIAVIVINNVPGPTNGMDGGTEGAGTNIPVVIISDVDGATIINAMLNGPVVMFMGDKRGYYDNDLAFKAGEILRPRFSSMPSELATDGDEYEIQVGGSIFNYGTSAQTNVKLQALIIFEGDTLYNEVAPAQDIASEDSANYTLPTYKPTKWDEGYYSFNYISLSDSVEEDPADNESESDFVISGDMALSYASIDKTTMVQNSEGGSRPTGETYFSSCINFKDDNASRIAPKSISFVAMKNRDDSLVTMEGEEVYVQVFTYDDIFVDIDDSDFANPIDYYGEFMKKEYTYPADLMDEVITVEFDAVDIQALEDGQRYLFCATTFSDKVFFGTDDKRDYRKNRDHYRQPMFPVEGGMGSFNPNGFGPSTVPTVSVNFIDAALVNLQNEKLAINMNAYPSPASDILNVDFKQNEVSKVELINIMGQTVVAQNVTNNADKATMNVASVQNGVYIVKVYLTNNMTHTMQVVINH